MNKDLHVNKNQYNNNEKPEDTNYNVSYKIENNQKSFVNKKNY